ncbi:MAG: hypothetical protein HN509_12350 [Halobacteriovoraceae bacterium]|jgi:hypothetical protein|nr:hypothetical protein [Halobacteriovoraceae bacterium]
MSIKNLNDKKNKKKNPLYVVTNKGKDVEPAENRWDAFIKKYDLGPFIQFLQGLIDLMASQVKTYQGFLALKQLVDQLVAKLEKFVRVVDPVWAFSVFGR